MPYGHRVPHSVRHTLCHLLQHFVGGEHLASQGFWTIWDNLGKDWVEWW